MEYRVIVNPDYTFTANSGITLTHIANVGGGQEVYKGIVSETASFRTLSGDSTININESGDTILFSVSDAAWVSESEFSGYTANTSTTLNGLRNNLNTVSGDTVANTLAIATLTGTTGFVENSTFTGYTASTDTRLDGIDTTLSLKPDRTDIQGAGGTTVVVSGDTVFISSATPTGTTLPWGNITGTLSDQLDLQASLDDKVDDTVYQNDLQTLSNEIDLNEANLSAYTATTNSTISGIETNLNTHTGDSTIHYVQSAITITESQVSGLVSSLASKVDDNTFTGYTANTINNYVGSGTTQVTESGQTLIIYTPTADTSTEWGEITGTLSGQTDLQNALDDKVDDSVYQADLQILSDEIDALQTGVTANTSAIAVNASEIDYLSGVTDTKLNIADQTVTGFTASGGTVLNLADKNLIIYSPTGGTGGSTEWGEITGTLSNQTDLQNALDLKTNQSDFTGHTANTSVHWEMDELTGFTTTTDFNTYTGSTETELASKVDDSTFTGYTATTDSQIIYLSGVTDTKLNIADQYITGATASGGTVLDVTDKVLTIYSPTGGTSSTTLVGSGDTTVTLSGDTWIVYSPTGGTGGGDVTTEQFTGYTATTAAALNQKVDYPIYHDDLQTLGDAIDANTTLISSGLTGVTNLGTGTTIGNTSGQNVTLKSITVSGGLGISGDTDQIEIYRTTDATWGNITGTLLNQTDLQDALDQKVDYPLYHDDLQTLSDVFDSKETIVDITGTSHTLLSSQKWNVLEFSNTGDTTVLFPTGLTSGYQVTLVNTGAQNITLSGDTGVTLQSTSGLTSMNEQYTVRRAIYRGNDKFIIY